MIPRSYRYCLIPLAFSTLPALAAYKCIDESGAILYQDGPCPSNMRGGEMRLNANRSFSGQANSPESTRNFVPLPPDESMLPTFSEAARPANADKASAAAPIPEATTPPATASATDRSVTNDSSPSTSPETTPQPATTDRPPSPPAASATQSYAWPFHIDGSQ